MTDRAAVEVDTAVRVEVRRRVDERGWSLREVTNRLRAVGWEVTHPLVRRLLDGTRKITAGELLHLAYALDVPPIALLAPSGDTFRIGRDRRVTAAALESWIVGATPLPRQGDYGRYLDAARARSRPRSRFSDYLRRTADAFDRADNRERDGIVLDLLQHMAGVGLQQMQRRDALRTGEG